MLKTRRWWLWDLQQEPGLDGRDLLWHFMESEIYRSQSSQSWVRNQRRCWNRESHRVRIAEQRCKNHNVMSAYILVKKWSLLQALIILFLDYWKFLSRHSDHTVYSIPSVLYTVANLFFLRYFSHYTVPFHHKEKKSSPYNSSDDLIQNLNFFGLFFTIWHYFTYPALSPTGFQYRFLIGVILCLSALHSFSLSYVSHQPHASSPTNSLPSLFLLPSVVVSSLNMLCIFLLHFLLH